MSVNVEWMQQALCREVSGDLWFPESVGVKGQREAQAAVEICMSCPVVFECRDYGKQHSQGWGIWGAVNRTARRRKVVPSEPAHGTDAGAAQHRRRGERPCRECLKAAALAQSLRKEKRRA